MSHDEVFGRVRLLRRSAAPRVRTALLTLTLLYATGADASILPVTANCQSDGGGANDTAGETDITRSCVVAADGAPFELDSTSSLDLARLEGAASIHVCSLYNTDGDAFADLAVCAHIKGATGNGGNHLVLKDVQLYTCSDAAADRCSDAAPLAAPYSTNCAVTQDKADPFPGPAPGPGTHYPEDSLIHCQIDAADFGAAGVGAMPLDTCSYGSGDPTTDPSDCIAFKVCEAATDCDDGSPCTRDSCDVTGVCKYTAKPAVACSDSLYCDGDEACTIFGLCGSAEAVRDCNDDVDCTLDWCDEIEDSCENDPRNSVCSDGLFCDGVEICDVAQGCVAGSPPTCGDGVECTVDSCNEETNGCDHVAENVDCEAVLAQLAGQLP